MFCQHLLCQRNTKQDDAHFCFCLLLSMPLLLVAVMAAMAVMVMVRHCDVINWKHGRPLLKSALVVTEEVCGGGG
jgi:hypothetical protein